MSDLNGITIQQLLLDGVYWNGRIRHFEDMCEVSFEPVEMPTEEGYDPIRYSRMIEYVEPSWFPVFIKMGWINDNPINEDDYNPYACEEDIPF